MSNYILVVDDNPSDLLITSTLVEKEGFVAIQATNGFDALDKIAEYDFRLFIIDLQMPQMGGIELVKRIRKMESCRDTSVLITSARKESRDVKLAVAVGANDYIVKPVDSLIFEEKFGKNVGKKIEWKEYLINGSSENCKAYFRKSLELISINEVGVTIISSEELDLNRKIELGGYLFSTNKLGFVFVNIDECRKIDKNFMVKASFVGLNDNNRRKIRVMCQDIWKKQQQGEFNERNSI